MVVRTRAGFFHYSLGMSLWCVSAGVGTLSGKPITPALEAVIDDIEEDLVEFRRPNSHRSVRTHPAR